MRADPPGRPSVFAGERFSEQSDRFTAPALPHRQSHLIDPFVKVRPGGVLVQLVLEADLILPSRAVGGPGLVESVGGSIKDQRVVAILGGIGQVVVLLYVMPSRRPVRTRDRIKKPSSALAIPRCPVAVSKVALGAGHELVA